MNNLYLDKKLELSDGQSITSGSIESQNVIDFGVEHGSAEGKSIDIRVTEDFAGGTSVQFVLQDSANGTTFTDRITSTAYPAASLKTSHGNPLCSIAVPAGLGRYMRLKYVATGTFTKGKVHAILNTEVRV